MNPRLYTLAAAAALLLAGGAAFAQAPGPGPGPGPAPMPDGRVYNLGPFDAIEINGSAVVRFTQGASDQVQVEGGDDVQKAVEMDVRRGTLSVRSGGSWKFWNARRLQINVTARTLRRVTISGAADLNATSPVQVDQLVVDISGAGTARFDQLKAEQLSFHVSGAGDGRVAGSVKQVNIDVSGKSTLDAGDLMSDRARVSISGIGDVEVWVTQDLSVSVAGIGTVDYWGNPNVRRSVSGKATINGHGAKRAAP